jgi:hypothetical protein
MQHRIQKRYESQDFVAPHKGAVTAAAGGRGDAAHQADLPPLVSWYVDVRSLFTSVCHLDLGTFCPSCH